MSSIAFRNVRVFDGTHHQLTSAQDVVVADGVITSISDTGHPADQSPADIEINGAGHTLMPGLIACTRTCRSRTSASSLP